ncbi:MAG: hypothetical protein RL172_2588 [Bacteroidota bacterium]|jgi:RimJ/RimL family protein N-acetyltransferase
MIRKITAADFAFIYGLYMHPQINPYLLYEPMNETDFTPIFNELLQLDIIYIFEVNGQPAGMFKLVPQLHRNSHCGYLGGVAIAPAFAGQGYGILMMQQVLQLGQQLNMLRIELSTATTNHRAISLYKKAGFIEEGVLKKYTWLKSQQRFIDEVMMGYLYP